MSGEFVCLVNNVPQQTTVSANVFADASGEHTGNVVGEVSADVKGRWGWSIAFPTGSICGDAAGQIKGTGTCDVIKLIQQISYYC